MSELATTAAAANNVKEGGEWVRWFIKYTFSDFWDTKHDQDTKWVTTKIIRFWVPDGMSKEDEEIRAMEILQDIVGPSRKHLTGCAKCMYEDYDDYEHYFGVQRFHFVEKLPSVLPENNSEQEAQENQKKFERECQRISQARADHKRQLELAEYEKALQEKKEKHQQEVEKLKKQYGVE